MRGLKAVTDTDLEMWDFAEEYEDMKHIHDPLDGEQRDNKKEEAPRLTKTGEGGPTLVLFGVDISVFPTHIEVVTTLEE